MIFDCTAVYHGVKRSIWSSQLCSIWVCRMAQSCLKVKVLQDPGDQRQGTTLRRPLVYHCMPGLRQLQQLYIFFRILGHNNISCCWEWPELGVAAKVRSPFESNRKSAIINTFIGNTLTLKSNLDEVKRMKNQGGHNASTDPGVEVFKTHVTQHTNRRVLAGCFRWRRFHFCLCLCDLSYTDLNKYS